MAKKDEAIRKVANYLSNKGREIVNKAYQEANYNKDKTQNLKDSYGSAVFHDGKLLDYTVYTFSSRATQGRFNKYTNELEYGRYEINEFFKNYQATPNSFELVTAVAMFYGEYLQEGSGRIRKKYKVIANAFQDLKEVGKEFKGSTVKILNGNG